MAQRRKVARGGASLLKPITLETYEIHEIHSSASSTTFLRLLCCWCDIAKQHKRQVARQSRPAHNIIHEKNKIYKIIYIYLYICKKKKEVFLLCPRVRAADLACH